MKFEEHPRIVAHRERMNRLIDEQDKLKARQSELESLPNADRKTVSWDESATDDSKPKAYFSPKEYDANAQRLRELELKIQAGNDFFFGQNGKSSLRDEVGVELCRASIPQFVESLHDVRSAVVALRESIMKTVGVTSRIERDGGIYSPVDQAFLGPFLPHYFGDEKNIIDTWIADIDYSISRCSEHIPTKPVASKRPGRPEMLAGA